MLLYRHKPGIIIIIINFFLLLLLACTQHRAGASVCEAVGVAPCRERYLRVREPLQFGFPPRQLLIVELLEYCTQVGFTLQVGRPDIHQILWPIVAEFPCGSFGGHAVSHLGPRHDPVLCFVGRYRDIPEHGAVEDVQRPVGRGGPYATEQPDGHSGTHHSGSTSTASQQLPSTKHVASRYLQVITEFMRVTVQWLWSSALFRDEVFEVDMHTASKALGRSAGGLMW